MSADSSRRRHIATWNPALGVWETTRVGLLCEHSEPYSETWPSSGMTHDGQAYELPTQAHPTPDSESSSLLPTPAAGNFNDGEDPEAWLARREAIKAKGINGNGMGTPLAMAVQLLPTPRASDGTKGGPNQRGSSSGRRNLDDSIALLPTPRATDTGTPGRRASEGFRPPLSEVLLGMGEED